jgi:O-antigen/teichoic acid export membrane protein
MAAPEVAGPGHSGRRLLKDSVASLLDQGMLSALNLALGLVLIRLTAKENYGLYAQLYVAGILVGTLIEAIITAPLTTLAPGLSDERRRAFISHLDHYQRRLSAVLAIISGAIAGGVVALWQLDPHPVALGFAFAAYVWFGCLREFGRSVGFIEGRAVGVLHMDLWFALAVSLSIGALAWLGWMNLPAVLLALGFANLAALSLRPMAGGKDGPGRAEAVGAVWQRGRWSLPGALMAWLTNYSYLYLTALWLGVAASADLNASRLLLMPISLLVLAWSRVARPHAVRLLRARDMAALRRFTLLSVGGIEVITVVYSGLLWLMLPFLEARVLGPKYSGLEPLVVAWGVYFVLYSARWVGTSLLTSGDRYRMLLMSAVMCLVVMVAAASYALPRWGAWGAVAALAVVELIDVLLVWLVLLPRVHRDLVLDSQMAVDSRMP